jgi:hypothetical protein
MRVAAKAMACCVARGGVELCPDTSYNPVCNLNTYSPWMCVVLEGKRAVLGCDACARTAADTLTLAHP